MDTTCIRFGYGLYTGPEIPIRTAKTSASPGRERAASPTLTYTHLI